MLPKIWPRAGRNTPPRGTSPAQCCCACEVLLKAACDAWGANRTRSSVVLVKFYQRQHVVHVKLYRRQHVMHVVQGLIDAHVHMLIGGSSLQQIDLRGIASKADFVAAVQDAAGGLAFVRIIFHTNWALCLLQLSYGNKTSPRLLYLVTVS